MTDLHQDVQFELSVAHDEGRAIDAEIGRHVEECETCAAFARGLSLLDRELALGEFDKGPDLRGTIVERLGGRRRGWWAAAAVLLVGMIAGALVGGVGTSNTVQAQDLDDLFHSASPFVNGLTAELVVVERGWHPDVPERVYIGSLSYAAPEQISIDLIDTTSYPNDDWRPNDVYWAISNGAMTATASSPCPVAALPGCQQPPTTTGMVDRRPFDEGVLAPLEIIGPSRSVSWPSGVEVVGAPTLGGRAAIQVRTTVAVVELLDAITGIGAWRDLHPTDEVLLWLDRQTLVPLRVEVTPADNPERELWRLRRGYEEPVDGEPIFIVELRDVAIERADVAVAPPPGAPSGGFVDGPAEIPSVEIPAGFVVHRTGERTLPDGTTVEVASWSDGRSWLMVESTDSWTKPRLFGLSDPFAQRIDVAPDSVGYLDPQGRMLAIHTPEADLLVSGSVTEEVLVRTAASLGLRGMQVPDDWVQASVVQVEMLPESTLVPVATGWSMLGRIDDDSTMILMTAGGSRTVLVTQRPGARLDPPIGPDVYAVDVRSTSGRYDASTSTLEWSEGGWVMQMTSETVARDELVDLAGSMETR